MKATRSIAAGDEIFNDYGSLPRSDLLRMYGYVADSYAQYDVVELSLHTICEDDDLLRRLKNASGAHVASGSKLSRYLMALQVRKGEKEILQNLLDLVQQFITSKSSRKRKRDINDAGLETGSQNGEE